MEVIGIITGIISLIVLIVFFVMASNLSGIRKDTRTVEWIMRLYAERDGLLWTCAYCDQDNEGSREVCLNCEREKSSKSKRIKKSGNLL